MGITNPEERSLYEIESADQSWTLPELRRQFDSGLYERLALSRDKEGILRLAKEGQVVARPDDLLKEPFILEFLGLSERARYSESDLEIDGSRDEAVRPFSRRFQARRVFGPVFERPEERLRIGVVVAGPRAALRTRYAESFQRCPEGGGLHGAGVVG